ncbi:MAG: AAA family ATPase, partial [Anaerolineae bacterium]|nr:AAA family ATPase [Anaerolineae bacterium]
MARLNISLLGSFQVTLDGQPIARFESNKARALLAYLAVEASRPHRREALASMLWPDLPDRAAHRNLRTTLSRLRSAIRDRAAISDRAADPPCLLVERGTIQFNRASDCWVDVHAFQAQAATAQDEAHRAIGAASSRAAQWSDAVALYRGSFLEGFSPDNSAPFEDWTLLIRERLLRAALATLRQLTARLAQRGETERALGYAWRHVELAPWDEPAHREVMRLLALSGQRNAALAQYEACRRALQRELDVQPEAATVALYERIRDGGDLPVPIAHTPHNLPAQLAPFVGRERELNEIAQRLEDPACRLVSLVGPGGSGKTRLALEAAARQRGRYTDGTFFVSLAPLQSAEAIPSAVAQAIGLPLSGGSDLWQQVRGLLRRRRVLLVLDNAEHLLGSPLRDVATLTVDLLNAAPEVQVLVTSRVRLNVPGEHLLPVEGMTYPDQALDAWQPSDAIERYSAVGLFAQSACRLQPGFHLTPTNLHAVVRICCLVRGKPLGILLAATWVRVLPPAQIAAEIERGIDALATDWREVPARHTSMRAVFDHSWSLLPERARSVLAALSIFAGGFTRVAAQHVSGASLHDLMTLTNHSLVSRTRATASTATSDRFEIHELLRQYAAERLAQSQEAGAAVRDRHAAYYASVSERWATDVRGDRQLEALAEMDVERENVRVAWEWAAARGRFAQLERLFAALWRYADQRDRDRYASWFGETAQALSAQLLPAVDRGGGIDRARSGHDPEGFAAGIRLLSRLHAVRAYCGAEGRPQLARESLSLLERPELDGRDVRAERALALLSLALGEHARWAAEESLVLYRELGDPWGTAFMLCTLCWTIPKCPANYDHLRELYEEALSIAQAHGDRTNTAHAAHGLAILSLHQGQVDRAERLGRQALDLFERFGDRTRMAWVHDLLGTTAMAQGQFAQACATIERGRDLYLEVGRDEEAARAEWMLGMYEMHRGRYAEARRHGEHVHTLGGQDAPERFAASVLLAGIALAEGAPAQTRSLLADRDLTPVGDQSGRHLLDHTPSILACALIRLGDHDRARHRFREALRLAPEADAFWPLLHALVGYALLLAAEGETERAVELYALASRYPYVARSRWFGDAIGVHIAAGAEALPADAVRAAQERGGARDLAATVQEMAAELGMLA